MKKIPVLLILFAICITAAACMTHTEYDLPDITDGIPSEFGTETESYINTEAETDSTINETESDVENETETEKLTEKITESETETEISINTEETSGSAIGGWIPCIHDVDTPAGFQIGYHSIGGPLTKEYIKEKYGDNALDIWEKERGGQIVYHGDESEIRSCTEWTVWNYIHDFDIPRELFELEIELFGIPYEDYNIDVLYGTREEAEAYYTSDRTFQVMARLYMETFKRKLKGVVFEEDPDIIPKWIAEKNNTEWGYSEVTRSHIYVEGYGYADEFKGNYEQYSLAEFIKDLNIPRDVVENVAKELSEEYYAYRDMTLDFDKLYSESGEILEIDTSKLSDTKPITIDRGYVIYNGK